MVRWISLVVAALLSACGNQATLLPQGERSMLEIYTEPDGSADRSPRFVPPAPPSTRSGPDSDGGPRVVFERLPNPDLYLYVFAHRATADGVPIPGYTTVFPLYQRVAYALPGDAGE